MHKSTTTLALLSFALLLHSGCATGASSTAMQIQLPTVEKQHPETVSITVTGGKETSQNLGSQVSNNEFQAALVATIGRTRVFSSILPGQDGDMLLEIQLLELQQPTFGLTMTVTAVTKWTLRNRVDGQHIWGQTITRAHSATTGDTLLGAKRLQLANEGAIQAVIKAGVEEISKLRFK